MISVVIPLYNKEASIKQSLMSVLSQSYQDFEVVIVDDGSTDDSVSVVEGMADSRIRLVRQSNGGVSSARNKGALCSNGEWLVFLDADDVLLPGALSCFAGQIKEHDGVEFFCAPYFSVCNGKRSLQFQYGDSVVVNPYREHFYGRLLPRTGAFCCSRRLCIDFPFDERIRRFEDLEWLYRIYCHTDVRTFSQPVLDNNIDYSSASSARKDIKEDFLGYLDFKGKPFWERMALYAFYLGEREYYNEQCRQLYPWLYRRYDWLLISKIIGWIK